MVGKIEKKCMGNPRKRTRKRRREKGEKRWDRGKGDLGEQFRFTLHIHPKRNVAREFYLSHVKTFLYTWYNFISQNASVLDLLSVHDSKPINLDKTLALYFQRPHGVFRIVNEMIERQWIFSYKENIHQIYWKQYAPSCFIYIDWYNTDIKVS